MIWTSHKKNRAIWIMAAIVVLVGAGLYATGGLQLSVFSPGTPAKLESGVTGRLDSSLSVDDWLNGRCAQTNVDPDDPRLGNIKASLCTLCLDSRDVVIEVDSQTCGQLKCSSRPDLPECQPQSPQQPAQQPSEPPQATVLYQPPAAGQPAYQQPAACVPYSLPSCLIWQDVSITTDSMGCVTSAVCQSNDQKVLLIDGVVIVLICLSVAYVILGRRRK